MPKKYEVEVVKEFYTYVFVELPDDAHDGFTSEFDTEAIEKAEEIPDDEWYCRRDPYVGIVSNITGRR